MTYVSNHTNDIAMKSRQRAALEAEQRAFLRRGGKVTDPKGSIHREYEKDFYLDPFRFQIGVPFKIRREVKWDAVHGYSRCFINGEKLHEVLDVPTFPVERAEGSMFRVGFFPGDGEVNPLLDMQVEGLKFQVPA